MIKKFLILLILLFACAVSAQAGELTIQATTIQGWNDTRTNTELWLYLDQGFIAADGTPMLAGNTNNRIAVKRIVCTVNTGARTISIPSFTLTSTTDGLDITTARYSAFFCTPQGAVIKAFDGFDSFRVPDTIISTTGCTPVGSCAAWSDIRTYNFTRVVVLRNETYTKDQINAAFAALQTSISGAPIDAKYIVQSANSTLTNEQALSALATGLLKNTTGAGVLSIAVAGTDYEPALTFSSPLARSVNTISIQTASSSQAGALSAADWITFNAKQAALGFTPENSANKNASSGYAGLSGGKLALAQGQEVWSLADLTDATGASGTGSTVLKGTFTAPSVGQVPTWTGTNWEPVTPSGTGTVTSVALTAPSVFSVSGSPITSSGTLAMTFAGGQTQNLVLASPDGSSGAVALRALVNNDLPVVNQAHGGGMPTSIGSAYQIVGVNSAGTANVYHTLAAGSNVTITPVGTTITISAATSGAHNLLSSSHSDTTATSPPTRGAVIVGQGSGAPSWALLARGAQYTVLQSDGTDTVFGAVNLAQAAAVTGILGTANGGLGVDASGTNEGAIPIKNGSGFTIAQITAGSNITITPGPGTIQIDASGTLGTEWSSLTSPSGNLALTMNARTSTFTYGNATSTADLFKLTDTASNSGTGHLLFVNTATSSSAKPVGFFAGGTSNGVEMNTSGVLVAVGTGGITATNLNGVSGNGALFRTSAGNFIARTHTAGAGIAIADGDGVSGAPTYTWSPQTQVNNLTFWDGNNTPRTITFAVTGTDPVISFAASSIDVTTGTLKEGGSPVVKESRTLTGGTGINSIGDLSTNRTISVDQGFSPTWSGVHIFSPTARTSGAAAFFTITTPADTGLTASTEAIGISILGATRTHATGTLSENSDIKIAQVTHAFNGTSSAGTFSSFTIVGPPIAGANVSGGAFTLPLSLWVKTGDVLFAGLVKAGSGPTTLTDSSGKVLSAALNTVQPSEGGTGITSLGTGVATWLGTPSSANLASAVTGETGSGALVFGTSPTLTTPAISSIINTGTLTLPTSTDTLLGRATTDTLTNKTLTSSTNVLGGVTLTLGSDATGDIYYRNSGGVLTRLAIGSSGQYLVVSSGLPAWKAAPGVVGALTDAATIATDASTGNRFRVTLGGNRTLGNPTNPVDGQQVVWEFIQDGTGNRTITLGSKFVLGADITAVTLSTTASKRDFLTAIYNSSADKWYVVGFIKGFGFTDWFGFIFILLVALARLQSLGQRRIRKLLTLLLLVSLSVTAPARPVTVTRTFFASLTVFPNSGKPGTTSVDGDIGSNAVLSYATAQSTADSTDPSGTSILTTENSGTAHNGISFPCNTRTYSVIRALLNFDTSALGAGATISAAVLSVKPSLISRNDHADFVRVVTNGGSSNNDYSTSDYSTFGTTAQAGDINVSSLSAGTYADFTLNATGRGNISKTGITKFGLRCGLDISATTPTPIDVADCFTPGAVESDGTIVFFNSADVSGTSSDPKLVITYTAGGTPARNGDFFFSVPPPRDALLPRRPQLNGESEAFALALTHL